MWHLNATTLPAIMGALGMVRKGTSKNIEKIPGKSKLQELQKITLIGTAHILRKTSNKNMKIGPTVEQTSRFLSLLDPGGGLVFVQV